MHDMFGNFTSMFYAKVCQGRHKHKVIEVEQNKDDSIEQGL